MKYKSGIVYLFLFILIKLLYIMLLMPKMLLDDERIMQSVKSFNLILKA